MGRYNCTRICRQLAPLRLLFLQHLAGSISKTLQKRYTDDGLELCVVFESKGTDPLA